MSILCVDNSETIRKVVKDCALDLGFDFHEASNCDKGLEVAQNIPDLDLLILDWNLPGMKGEDLVRKIKSNEQLSNIKILVLIKFEQKDQVMNAVDAGVTNYILKPFRVNDLQNKIEDTIKNAG